MCWILISDENHYCVAPLYHVHFALLLHPQCKADFMHNIEKKILALLSP